jgi:hypothetical protein
LRAPFVSGPIGPGHVQRDLAISRELRKIRPDPQVGWFTFDPAARCLRREGERLHPIASRLAIGSRHFESIAGEHNLHAFFALRTMDEVMVNGFMTSIDLMEEGHLDHVIGDEAWGVDRPVARNRRASRLRAWFYRSRRGRRGGSVCGADPRLAARSGGGGGQLRPGRGDVEFSG